MLNVNLNLRIPRSNRFENIKCWHGSTPFKNKFWEFQVYRSSDLINFSFDLNFKQDHAGLRLEVGLATFNCIFNFYDSRHWDHEADNWEKYGHYME